MNKTAIIIPSRLDAIRLPNKPLKLINNKEMILHVYEAAMKAAEAVDSCLERLVKVLLDKNYAIIVIADHGNSEYMINEDGSPNTAHTTNLVPCFLLANDLENVELQHGKLADIAPTLLHLMQIEAPAAMTGNVLIKRRV